MQSTLISETAPAREVRDQAAIVRKPGWLRQRSRATLLWAVAAFVLLQAGLRWAIDCWMPEMRDPQFEIKARELTRRIAQFPEAPATVLMFGSSITEHAFKAKLLEDLLAAELKRPAAVFNFGRPGGGPLSELVLVRRLLDRGNRPNLVLLEITPFLFNSAAKPVDIGRFPVSILEQGDVAIVQRYGLDDQLAKKWWQNQLIPSYNHRLTIVNYFAQNLVPAQDRVFFLGRAADRFWYAVKPRPVEERKQVLGQLAKDLAPTLKHITPGASSLQALEELLELLKKEKVPAALVLMPNGPTLRGLYAREDINRFLGTVTELGRKYDCPFIDAFDWLDEDMFNDSHHAHVAGADCFTKKLAADFVVPALSR